MDMTEKQIENWRKLLVEMIGPYASLMSAEEIEQMRDKFQEQIDELEVKDD